MARSENVPKISFTTLANRSYRVAWKDAVTNPQWTALSNATNIPGTGGAVQVSDTETGGSDLPAPIYRAVVLP